MTLAFQEQSTAVQFGHYLTSCTTRLSLEADDRSYDPPLDLGQLFFHPTQTSGSALPRTITFTEPHSPISTGATTTSHTRNDMPLAAPATNASHVRPESLRLRTVIFETISIWLSGLSWYIFPVQKLLFDATNAQTSGKHDKIYGTAQANVDRYSYHFSYAPGCPSKQERKDWWTSTRHCQSKTPKTDLSS